MNNWLIRLWMTVCFMGLFSSCERRPLGEVDNKVKVRVILNVNTMLNVTTGVYNEKIPVPEISPKIIRVIFYDVDTGDIASQGFISKKGYDEEGNVYLEGSVNILPGTYDMLCYNFDTPSTLVKDEGAWNTIMAYTSEISEYLYSRFQNRGYDVSPTVYYEPDHLLVAREPSIIIPEHAEVINVHTDASSIIDTYYIQVRLVNGEYASDATAILTDMVSSNKFGLNERNYEEFSGIFFEMQRSVDTRIRANNQEVLCALFNTFGKRPENARNEVESQLFVTFNVLTSYGEKVEMVVDMDSIFRTRDAIDRHWLLIDKEFVIPKPPAPSGGGFKPSVNDWDKEEGFIELQ